MIGGGLFGNQQPKPVQGGGLFGNNAPTGGVVGGGLFGGQQGAPATGGLFGQPQGAPAATGGLFANQTTTTTTGGLFGQQPMAGGAATGGLFGQQTAPAVGGGLFGQQQQPNQQIGGGIFGGMQQQQQPLQNTGYFGGQMQTLQGQGQMLGVNMQDQRHELDVQHMLQQHHQILNFQSEFTSFLKNVMEVTRTANQTLITEAQKLQEGKAVLTAKTTQTSLTGATTQQQQFVEKKGINKETIEKTSDSLTKIREKNEVIFAKLLEIHCLIERVSSNANTIDRDSNAETRIFHQFNDIDSKIHGQNQKLIDLNHKLIDSKNIQESAGSAGASVTGGTTMIAGSAATGATASSARDHNGSMNSAAVIKRKQVLIEMLAQMKKGIEIVKEQHQEDSKDFEILIKKLNASRTLPF